MTWQTRPLEDFLTRLTYGFTCPMPTVEDGPYMVTAKDVNYGRILYESARRTSQTAFDNKITDKCRPNIGDVLVTKDGTLGRIAIVDRENVCINQSVALLQPNQKIRPQFLRYLLEEPYNFGRMLGDADGTTIKHIYITRLAKMEVSVPNLREQDEISAILGALDDKIELNRKTAATLEEMARALYRSWFVDFDPVHARSQGLPPAHLPPTTAALFPDSFGEDGLPDGWELGTISSLGDIVTGKTPSTKDAANFGDYCPFVKIPDMHGKMFVTNPSTYLSEKGVSTQKRQLLEAGSVSVSCIATLGLVTISPKQAQTNQQINSVVPSPEFSTEFVYWTCFEAAKEVLLGGSGGSVFGNVNKSTFAAIPVQLAEPEIRLAFTSVVSNLHDKILQIENENQTLATLRDTLLPRLMSGELRVGDAREKTEEIR